MEGGGSHKFISHSHSGRLFPGPSQGRGAGLKWQILPNILLSLRLGIPSSTLRKGHSSSYNLLTMDHFWVQVQINRSIKLPKLQHWCRISAQRAHFNTLGLMDPVPCSSPHHPTLSDYPQTWSLTTAEGSGFNSEGMKIFQNWLCWLQISVNAWKPLNCACQMKESYGVLFLLIPSQYNY